MVDIPFVSEDFQRAYRNQFPSQTSSGRDLHVSDVVIPIVDFTGTSAGTSLPLDLRNCLNNNSSVSEFSSSQSNTTLISTAGFYQMYYNADFQNGTANTTTCEFNILNNTTASTNIIYKKGFFGETVSQSYQDSFVVYLPSNNILRLDFALTTGVTTRLYVTATQVADVNGNLQNPSGFNPQ